MAPRRSVLVALSSLALGLALGACDTAPLVSECVPGVDQACEPPRTPDDVVAGVNLSALFARPTSIEVDAALAAALPPTVAQASLSALPDGPDGARRYRLALDSGADRLLTALVRIPGGFGSSPLPVVVVLPDGVAGASAEDLLTAQGYGALPNRTVQVVVAYRGEALTVDGEAIASALPPDPYRADVADVRAVLGALDEIPRAQAGRVALVGFGRGGTVALLAAPGTTVDAVVTLGAPTDLFAASAVAQFRARLLGQTPPATLPALDALAAPVLALRDGAGTLAESRLGLLALSPARLRPGDRLPALLALHADGDIVVGRDHLEVLAGALGTHGVAEIIENQSHESLPAAEAVQSRVTRFLLDTL